MGEEGRSRGGLAEYVDMNDRYDFLPEKAPQLALPWQHLWSCFYEASRTLTIETAPCVFDKTLPVKAWGLAWVAEEVIGTWAESAVVDTAGSGASLWAVEGIELDFGLDMDEEWLVGYPCAGFVRSVDWREWMAVHPQAHWAYR